MRRRAAAAHSEGNAAGLILTPQASRAFVNLQARKKQLDQEINAIALGAGITGEYYWNLDEGEIVTLFHGRPPAPPSPPSTPPSE